MELKEFQELVLKQFDNISEQFKKVADRLDSLEKGQDELRKRQDELTVGVEILARERGDVKVQKAMELAKELHDNFKERHRSACCRVLTKDGAGLTGAHGAVRLLHR